MIAHLRDRAAALGALGWTGRDAEWLALVCLHSGVFLRSQHLAFLGRDHGELATRFIERYRQWCGRRVGRRSPIERVWRGSMRLCIVAPRSLYRALGAEHVRHRQTDPHLRIRTHSPDREWAAHERRKRITEKAGS